MAIWNPTTCECSFHFSEPEPGETRGFNEIEENLLAASTLCKYHRKLWKAGDKHPVFVAHAAVLAEHRRQEPARAAVQQKLIAEFEAALPQQFRDVIALAKQHGHTPNLFTPPEPAQWSYDENRGLHLHLPPGVHPDIAAKVKAHLEANGHTGIVIHG